MPKEEWTDRDLELEEKKTDALNEFSISEILWEALLEFLGISDLTEYFKTKHKKWYDHLIALIVSGAYLTALWLFTKFMFKLIQTKSFWIAITAIIGNEGLKKFILKIGKSWFIWFLILDLLLVIWSAIRKFIEKNDTLKKKLWHLYIIYWDAPHRDEIFKINIGGIPKKP